jgi:hypothetical protein
MLLYVFWSFVASVVLLKLVDWSLHDWKHVTYTRTALFSLSTMLALATVVLFIVSLF